MSRLADWLRLRGRARGIDASGYDAFISYSHAADGRLAPALQRGLRGFAKPWNRLHALRVFRDQTSLSASPALWSGIERALAQSRFFILLASPEAATSEWVGREVTYWRDHKPTDAFLIGLTEGEIVWDPQAGDFDWEQTTALPRAVETFFAAEPLWVDLRFARVQSDASLRQPDFRNAVADLAAPIHGRERDTLLGEDITQYRRTLRLARSAAAVLVGLLAVASVLAFLAYRERDTARAQRDEARSVVLASIADGLVSSHVGGSLLLALVANRLDATAQARSAMIRALEKARRAGVSSILEARCGSVARVAVSPDGRTLATDCLNGSTQLWGVATRARLGAALTASGCPWASSAAFSPDGRTLATGCVTKKGYGTETAQLWNVENQAPIGAPFTDHNCGLVASVAFSPDRQTLATGCFGYAELWNIATQKQIGTLPTPIPSDRSSPEGVMFSPHGDTLATFGRTGVRLWNVSTLKQLGTRLTNGICDSGMTDLGADAAFSPSGDMLAATCNGIQLWNVTGQTPHRIPLNGRCPSASGVAFSPSGRTLATICDQHALLWNVATRTPRGAPLNGARCGLVNVAFSPDGRTLAAGCAHGNAEEWDLATRTHLATTPLIIAKYAKLINPSWRTAKLKRLSAGGCRSINGAAFSPDGKTLAASCNDGDTQLWRIVEGRPRGVPLTLSRHSGCDQINQTNMQFSPNVAFSPNGRTVATACQNGSTMLWDVTDGTPRGKRLIGRGCAVAYSVAFSPNGQTLATGCGADFGDYTTGNVQFWNVDARTQIGEPLHGICDTIDTLAFSPDGRTLAAGCGYNGNGYVQLWDVAARLELGAPLESRCDEVDSLVFASEGRSLATDCQSGGAQLWEGVLWSSFANLESQVCGLVWGGLTSAEWSNLVPGFRYQASCPG